MVSLSKFPTPETSKVGNVPQASAHAIYSQPSAAGVTDVVEATLVTRSAWPKSRLLTRQLTRNLIEAAGSTMSQ